MKLNLKKTTNLTKRVALLAVAAIIGLASCSTETENVLNNGNTNGENGFINGNGNSDLKSVNLKLVSKMSSTRAESNSVNNGESVVFNGGFLLFASEQYNITKVVAITATNSSANTDTEIDINLLTQTDGAEISNVPGHSKHAYVIGNLPASISNPRTGESLAALKKMMVQYSSQDNISNATLFGGEEITLDALTSKYVAKFELAPLVARIEIGKIESAVNSDITSFAVDGIFINNYYESISLAGDAPAIAIKNTQTTDFTFPSTAYPASTEGILVDYKGGSASSLGTSSNGYSYTPSAGKNVWAYNLLAPKTGSSALTAPHIVIRLSNILTTNSVEYKDVWYLTVSGLKVGSKKVDYLEPGKVYSIKNITFSHSNIQPEPEMKTMDVSVEVKLVEWEVLDTDVTFGQE
jgi:hypothetical protein